MKRSSLLALPLALRILAHAQPPPLPPPPPPPPRARESADAPSLFAPQQTLKFEVASVRRSRTAGSEYIIGSGRLTLSNRTLKSLVCLAYGIENFQVAGAPPWFDSNRYDVVAKAPGNATRAELLLMLRSLLAERFHLAAHPDKKDVAVYALVVDGKSQGLKPSPPGTPQLSDVSEISTRPSAASLKTVGKNATMKQLAAWLSMQVDRKVVDKTGLRGGYDFTAEWANGGANVQSSDTGAPGVFTAVRELGLKLEPQKLPFEVLVIDGANLVPTEN
jgi:uncharacterized protein (TIGR03435 family)